VKTTPPTRSQQPFANTKAATRPQSAVVQTVSDVDTVIPVSAGAATLNVPPPTVDGFNALDNARGVLAEASNRGASEP
jgi:hypothetical protein